MAGTPQPIVARPTYGHLHEALDSLVEPPPYVENYHSTLNRWMEIFGYNAGSPLGGEWSDNFADARVEYEVARRAVRRIGDKPLGNGTIQTELSRLPLILDVAKALMKPAARGETFAERFRNAMEDAGLSYPELGELVSMSHKTLYNWSIGVVPSTPASRAKVPAIEAALGLPRGALGLPELALKSHHHPDRVRPEVTAFGRAILSGIAEKNWTVADLARESGVPDWQLRTWVRPGGSIPTGVRRTDFVSKIAAALGIRDSKLRESLTPEYLSQQTYSLDLAAATRLQAEWSLFYVYKTRQSQSDASRRPIGFWRETTIPDGNGGRSVSCPTADVTLAVVLQFGGWLAEHAPSHLRVAPRDFSLLDFARFEALEQFVEWRARRKAASVIAGEDKPTAVYTRSHLMTLTLAASLLRRRHGYLWQAFESGTVNLKTIAERGICRGSGGGEPTLDEWRNHCVTVFDKVEDWAAHLETVGLISERNAHDPIQKILDEDLPLSFLQDLADVLRADVQRQIERCTALASTPHSECTGKLDAAIIELATMRRDLLFISLISHIPLRLNQWKKLTYTGDDKGHLRRVRPGKYDATIRYEVSIPQKTLKSPNLNEGPYEAPVPADLTELLETHLLVDRPLLSGGTVATCSYVFRPSDVKDSVPPVTTPMKGLSSRLSFWSRQYLAALVPKGFGSHAVRHILAVHFVKNYDAPLCYEMASRLLGNTPEEVRRRYGKLKSAETNTKAQELIQAEFEKIRVARQDGE